MARSTSFVALAFLATGCSPVSSTLAPQGSQASPAALRCIPLEQVVGRRVAAPNGVLFEMLGGMTYRNQLQGQCPGLSRIGVTATISIASGGEGGRLCAGDRIRVADPVEARATGLASYPTCILGKFMTEPDPDL